MDKITELLRKIDIIQDELLEYNIVNALIFGSMIKGTNKLFSDFDIALKVDNIERAVENSQNMKSFGLSTRRICHIILEELGTTLRYKLNMDVNFDLSFDDGTYENSPIYSPRLEIIKDGVKVNSNILKAEIKEKQQRDFSVKVVRDINSQHYTTNQAFASYTACARYFPYIDTMGQFLQPENKRHLTMRNEIINCIAELCHLTEKIDEENLKETILPLESMKRLNELVRRKQIKGQNFNPLAVGWDVCCEDDLTESSLILFGQFYFDTQKVTMDFLEEIADDSSFQDHYKLYRRSVYDKEGFFNILEYTYQEKTYHQTEGEFKKVLKRII